MTTTGEDARYLDDFSGYLRGLEADARTLARFVAARDGDADESDADAPTIEPPGTAARRTVASALDALLASVDLMFDGLADLVYLEAAFALRVAASLAFADANVLASAGDQGTAEDARTLARLAREGTSVRAFLDGDARSFETYVRTRERVTMRGRTPSDVAADPTVARSLASDIDAWAKRYAAPSLGHDLRTLIKVRAFVSARHN